MNRAELWMKISCIVTVVIQWVSNELIQYKTWENGFVLKRRQVVKNDDHVHLHVDGLTGQTSWWYNATANEDLYYITPGKMNVA